MSIFNLLGVETLFSIGIDLGGTNIAAGIVDTKGVVIHKCSVPTNRDRPSEDIVEDMAQLCFLLLEQKNLQISQINSIGIGVPGVADNKNGKIIYCTNINCIRGIDIRYKFQKYFSTPVFIENDANCAALAESICGAAKGTNHSITITIGTGIGGGIIIYGRLYTGVNSAACEIGHMVIRTNGIKCACGRRGCWENYASATALINFTRKAVKNYPDSLLCKCIKEKEQKDNLDKIVFEAARLNDIHAKRLISRYITYLADGIVNLINIFQPEMIILAGGITNEGEYLLRPLENKINELVYGKDYIGISVKIKRASLGNDAGIVGAAMLNKNFQGIIKK